MSCSRSTPNRVSQEIYRHAAHRTASAVTSQLLAGGSRENQFLVMNEHALMVPPLIHTHSPGMVTRTQYSRSTVVRNPLTSGGLPAAARSDRYNPHAEARPYHRQQRSDSIIASAGPSRERTDALRYTEILDSRSHGNGRVRDEGYLAELPPGLRFDGLPNPSTGAQPHENNANYGPRQGCTCSKAHAKKGESWLKGPQNGRCEFPYKGTRVATEPK